MPGERFFDTSVLIYAFTAGDRRSDKAESLLADGGVIGVQVLDEFTNVVRRKLAWDWPQVHSALAVITELTGPALSLTAEIHAQAVKLARDSRSRSTTRLSSRPPPTPAAVCCSAKTCSMAADSAA